jgi:2-oxoglutarate dehydrogenase E2 component (dihydrolipoamide succinyltransferase)
VNSPEPGKVVQLYAKEGDTVAVGGELFKIEVGEVPAGEKATKTPASISISAPPPPPTPIVAAAPKPVAQPPPAAPPVKPTPPPKSTTLVSSGPDSDDFPGYSIGSRTERAVRLSLNRLFIHLSILLLLIG